MTEQTRWSRLAIFAIFGVWMFAGPFDRQVLGYEHVIFKAWRMYSGFGITGCVADFWRRDGEGSLSEIDRLSVLYGARWWEVPPPKRILRGHEAVSSAGKALCQELDAEIIVADAKCASTTRWKIVERRQNNLCTAEPVPKHERKRKKAGR